MKVRRGSLVYMGARGGVLRRGGGYTGEAGYNQSMSCLLLCHAAASSSSSSSDTMTNITIKCDKVYELLQECAYFVDVVLSALLYTCVVVLNEIS